MERLINLVDIIELWTVKVTGYRNWIVFNIGSHCMQTLILTLGGFIHQRHHRETTEFCKKEKKINIFGTRKYI